MATIQEDIISASDGLTSYEIGAKMCEKCQKLVLSLLLGDGQPFDPRWRCKTWKWFEYTPSRLWSFNSRHGNRHSALDTSYTAQFSFCTLLFESCVSFYGKTPTQKPYCIVGRSSPRHKRLFQELSFYVCFCEVSMLESQVEGFDFKSLLARPFSFFLRNGDESDFRFFGQSRHRRLPGLEAMTLAANVFPNSEEAIYRVREWDKECKETHSSCRRIASPLPKRVLDLAPTVPPGFITLYESKNEVIEYATLSYSWGTALPLRTTSSNIERHRKGLSIPSLPQTLRDAVHVAQRLDIRYLWIDALCIIQDDAADWANQAAVMTDIYEGSTICISALSAKDCSSGFLELPNTLSKIGICRYPPESSESRDVFVGWARDSSLEVVEESHLCTRGWTFQERLVSPVSLHYTDVGMFWECAERFVSETGSGDIPHRPAVSKEAWNLVRHGGASELVWDLSANSHISHRSQTFFQTWRRFVEQFSARELTNGTDKLPALAGIARTFWKQASITYVAGVWKEDFLSSLLWVRDTDSLKSIRPPLQYRAPSWSWASVDGRIDHPFESTVGHVRPGLDLQILSYDVEEAQEGTFGRVLGSSFKAMGLLQAVVLDRAKPVKVVEGVINGINPMFVLDQPWEWPGTLCSCFCLRLGVFDIDNVDALALLLVVPTGLRQNEFRRVGAGRVLVWNFMAIKGGIDYDVFVAGERIELTMV